MQDINIRLNADAQELLQSIQEARRALGGLNTTTQQVQNSLQEAFDEGAKDAKTLTERAANVNKMISEQQQQLANLIRYQKVLKELQKSTTDPARLAKYNKELAEAEKTSKALAKSLNGLEKAEKSSAGIAANLGKLGGYAAAAAAIFAVGKEIIAAADGAEKLRSALKRAFDGNEVKAAQLTVQLKDFADEIGISVEAATSQFISLQNRGFKPTIEGFRGLADIAAFSKKPIDQLVEAILDAQTGEFERLKEFGIRASKEGDNATFKFGNLSKTVKLTGDGVKSFFDTLSKDTRVLGAATEQAQGFDSAMTRLGNAITKLFSNQTWVGKLFSGIINGITDTINVLGKLTDTEKTATQTVQSMQTAFNANIEALKTGNLTSEQRKRIIDETNTAYGKYLPNLITEKTSIAELTTLQAEANKQFEKHIVLLSLQDRFLDTQKKRNKLIEEQISLEKSIGNANANATKGTQTTAGGVQFTVPSEEQANVDLTANVARDRIKKQLEELASQDAEVFKIAKEQGLDITKEFIKTSENAAEGVGKNLSDLDQKYTNSLEKIKEAIAKEKRKIDEVLRVENKSALDKNLEQEKINLENKVSIFKDYLKDIKGNSAAENDLRKQIGNLIALESEQSEKQNLKIRAEYALKDAELLQQKADIIDKYTQEGLAKEVAALERQLDVDRKKLDAAKATNEEIEIIYKAHFENVRALEQKYELIKLQEFEDNDKGEVALLKRQLAATLEAQETAFNAEKRSAAEIDAFKEKQGKQREINAELVAKRLLEIELFYAQKRGEVSGKPEQEKIDNITAQIAEIDKNIAAKTGNAGKGKGKKGVPDNLYETIGLDEKSAKLAQEATDKIVDAINQIADARAAAAEKAVEAANKEVDAATEALDREIELAQLGFASNVDLRKQELADAKAAQAEALEERRKAARLQLAIDTAQQISSIALSAAQMFSAYAGIPFAGPIIAAVSIASMLALIASTKARAASISQNQFEQGGGGRVTSKGVVVGNRHSDGGVPLEVEGGEFFATDGKQFGVVNRKMTHKHFGLLEAVNNDDRNGMMRYAMQLDREVPTRLLSAHSNNIIVNGASDKAEMRENNRLLKAILKNLDNSESVIDLGDSYLIKKRNRQQIVKKG